MKLTINHDVLADAVTWTARALPQRPSVPVLAGLLLSADDGALTMSAHDYDISARCHVDADIAEPGRALISGRILAEIIKALPHKPVQLSLTGSEVTITCGPAEFALLTMPADDYPSLPAIPDAAGTIDASVLRDAINQVTPAAGKDGTLAMLTGVRVDITGDRMVLAATDRYRLAARTLTWQPEKPDITAGILIPATTLHDLAKGLHPGPATIGLTDALASVTNDGRTTTTRLLDPDFPKYEKFFEGNFSATAVADSGALAAVIKRVAVIAERNTPVRLAFTTGAVRVHAGSGDIGRGSEELPVDYDGQPLEIAFNPPYILDALAAFRSSHVHLRMQTPVKPAVLTAEGDPGYQHLVMPLRTS